MQSQQRDTQDPERKATPNQTHFITKHQQNSTMQSTVTNLATKLCVRIAKYLRWVCAIKSFIFENWSQYGGVAEQWKYFCNFYESKKSRKFCTMDDFACKKKKGEWSRKQPTIEFKTSKTNYNEMCCRYKLSTL